MVADQSLSRLRADEVLFICVVLIPNCSRKFVALLTSMPIQQSLARGGMRKLAEPP
jgi:hypothetical protein